MEEEIKGKVDQNEELEDQEVEAEEESPSIEEFELAEIETLSTWMAGREKERNLRIIKSARIENRSSFKTI